MTESKLCTSSSSISSGAIVGIVMGCVIFLALMALLYRRRVKRKHFLIEKDLRRQLLFAEEEGELEETGKRGRKREGEKRWCLCIDGLFLFYLLPISRP